MKKFLTILKLTIAIPVLVFCFMFMYACTDNQRARTFGGTETLNVTKGQKVIGATWKEDDLWVLTEPMDSTYKPTTKTLQEKSSFGMVEGTVIFVESR
jgi:hypothetical protein